MKLRSASDLAANLKSDARRFRVAIAQALLLAGGRIRAEAQSYAPISPTQAQKNRLRKTTRKTKKKATAFTRAKPGGLRRSIAFDVDDSRLELSVFIADNAEARDYAERIHDGEGREWRNLGPGSIAANAHGKVGGMFIDRAVADNEKHLRALIERKIEGAMR